MKSCPNLVSYALEDLELLRAIGHHRGRIVERPVKPVE
jgi:hypothetical protein